MDNEFSFFESALFERRVYRCRGEQAAWRYEWMTECGLGELVTNGVTDGQGADFTFAGTHLMNGSGSSIGLARINERFNVTLPSDIDSFYRRWDGGVLLFREFYPLLSIEQMLEVNAQQQEWGRWEKDKPLRLIRFCDLGNSDYLCLRLDDDGRWDTIIAYGEAPDSEYFLKWHELRDAAVLENTFTAWLQRMIKTDGWPLRHPGVDPDDVVPPTERVG